MADASDPLTIHGSAPSPAPLSATDRDALIRTVLTEAASNDPDGWGGVANVIRNRTTLGADGGYADTPAAVVTAPNQFEVWSNGRAQKVDPNSADYERAGRVVDGVFDGSLPDNTSGSTNFYSPEGQAALGRAAPSWAKDPVAQIGGQNFYAPNGPVARKAAAPGAAPASAPAPAQSAAPAPAAVPAALPATAPASGTPSPALSAFDSLEVEDPARPAAAPQAAQAAAPSAQQPAAAQGTLAQSTSAFDSLAVDMPGSAHPPAGQPAAPAGTTPPVDHGAVTSGLMGALNGIPIAGPALLSGAEKAGAAIATLRDGGTYADHLAKVQGSAQATTDAHPVANAVGQVGGAVVGLAPALAAAPEAFGVAGGNMLTRMALGAASNGLVGGLDSAARGQNVAGGALLGAAGGGVAPPVGKLVGNALGATLGGGTGLLQAGINKLTTGSSSGMKGVSMPAATFVLDGINADGLPAVRNKLTELGEHGMLLDTGPGSRGSAAGMLKPSSPEGSTITNALTDRDAGSNNRVMGALNDAIGPERDPQQIVAQMDEARKAATSPVYSRVLANAPPVDTSGVVAQIDDQLRTAVGAQERGLRFLRDRLVLNPGGVDATGAEIPPTYESNAERLLNLRQELDKALGGQQEGLGLRPAAVTRADRSITSARASLDDALKGQVPGLADVDAAFAHSADVQNAVDNGFNKVLGPNGPHPDTFAIARAGQHPDVAQGENVGIAGRIYRKFGGGTQRDVVKLDQTLAGGDDGYATRNLATAFGQENADNLLDTVAREKTFANSSAELIGKSNTNRLGAALKRGQDTEPGSLNVSGMTPLGAVAQGAKKLIGDPLYRIITANPNASRNLEIAQMLTAKGADAQHVLDGLSRLDAQFKGASALGGAINSAGNALIGYGAPALADTAGGWNSQDSTPNALAPVLTIKGPRR